MEFIQLDLNSVCRTCKSESPEMKSLYYKDSENGNKNLRLDEMLMACASVQVNNDDGLPKFICLSCYMRLENAYAFKQQCENTDVFLKEYLKNLKNMYVKEETFAPDLEYSANFIDDIRLEPTDVGKDKSEIEEIKDDPEVHTDQVVERDMNYIQIFGKNIPIYQCTTCSKDFPTLDELKLHKKIHCVFVCKICNKALTRLDHSKRHLITHLKEKPFICSKCCRGFNHAANLENHVARCKGDKVYFCDICNKPFSLQHSMEVHRKTHQNKSPMLLTLENLDNIWEYYMEIDYDEKTVFIDEFDEDYGEEDFDVMKDTMEPEVEDSDNHDKIKIDEIAQITNEIYVEEDPPKMLLKKAKIKEEIYSECENVDIGPDNGNDLDSDDSRPKGRLSLKHRSKPESQQETSHFECHTTSSMLERHAKQQHDGAKRHECETCRKKFSTLSRLKRHKLVHLETKPFVCVICLKCFSRKDHMQKHMKVHNSKDVHTCNVCQAVFRRAEKLIRHKTSKHGMGDEAAAKKKYECVYCMKEFATESYRNSHVKAHLGGERHQCEICEKSFMLKWHLTSHMKSHNSSSKNFLCSECGQRFSQNAYLITHMRRHRGDKPFKCKFCGKGFPRATDLKVHEKYHTGEKTHLCVICGRGFARAYSLTVHMRTHTGEKPYRCTYCDAAFAQGNDLKAHVRRHTGERFQCDMCSKTFMMGYLLTQHKRVVHGLNIVSNISRLKPVDKINADDPPPIAAPLPSPVIVSTAIMIDPLQINKTEISPEELKQE